MKNIVDYINDNEISAFEDFSESLLVHDNCFKYENCNNCSTIIEGTFNRLMDILKHKDFAIISAYRQTINGKKVTKKENIKRNRKLRSILNNEKMGVYQLVGHWIEKQDDDSKIDAIERSYVVPKIDDMDFEDFKKLIVDCLTIDNETQDAAIIHQADTDDYFVVYRDGSLEKIGSKLTFNKISQAYSTYVKDMDVPFVFEGVESPQSNIGCFLFSKNLIYYI